VVAEVVQETHLQEHQLEVNLEVQVVVQVKQIVLVNSYFLEQVILLQSVHHKVFQVVQVI
tara:strand:+ start:95 stop:274 length:180 start_codon:yes stop_codon:yes gene_type:complete